jgi:bifunctional N-acetylglucosamine-1-phosphate-uridyltransferase/glucosamine-1-phosphate-acetyltransferase GlmU-like protein
LNAPLRLPELWSALPPALAAGWDPSAPWALLGAPLDALLATLLGPRLEAALADDVAAIYPGVHFAGKGIMIGKHASIAPGAMLEGPLWLGEDVEVRTGAYIRGGCWIGDHCRIGANTEVKRSILLPHAKAPHLNYVGDSILGSDVNLGAGTVLSNFRHDGKPIVITSGAARIDTGRRKLGAILGDGVKTGCNSVLHPGTIVGRDTEIYPLVQLRAGIYPARSIVKLRQDLDVIGKR